MKARTILKKVEFRENSNTIEITNTTDMFNVEFSDKIQIKPNNSFGISEHGHNVVMAKDDGQNIQFMFCKGGWGPYCYQFHGSTQTSNYAFSFLYLLIYFLDQEVILVNTTYTNRFLPQKDISNDVEYTLLCMDSDPQLSVIFAVYRVTYKSSSLISIIAFREEVQTFILWEISE